MSERRDYFRTNLSAVLEYQCITQKQLHTQDLFALFEDGPLIKIHTELSQLDNEAAQLLQQIKEKDRVVGEYLHLLNRKIGLLSDAFISSQGSGDKPPQTINMSELGLHFITEDALPKNQFIALHILFSTSSIATMLFAEVTRCEPSRDNNHKITAKFHYTTGAQKQQINQHMMRAQLAAKRDNA